MITPRFKIGDRVQVAVDGMVITKGRRGTVKELSVVPLIHFDDYNPRAHPMGDLKRGIPDGYWDCVHQDYLEPITNTNPMNDELKITKAAVLEAASKCSTAKATLQVLFPDAFKPSDEPFKFGGATWTTAVAYSQGPLMVADSSAPHDLKGRCLFVCPGWEMRQQEHEGRTILTFYRKP